MLENSLIHGRMDMHNKSCLKRSTVYPVHADEEHNVMEVEDLYI